MSLWKDRWNDDQLELTFGWWLRFVDFNCFFHRFNVLCLIRGAGDKDDSFKIVPSKMQSVSSRCEKRNQKKDFVTRKAFASSLTKIGLLGADNCLYGSQWLKQDLNNVWWTCSTFESYWFLFVYKYDKVEIRWRPFIRSTNKVRHKHSLLGKQATTIYIC